MRSALPASPRAASITGPIPNRASLARHHLRVITCVSSPACHHLRVITCVSSPACHHLRVITCASRCVAGKSPCAMGLSCRRMSCTSRRRHRLFAGHLRLTLLDMFIRRVCRCVCCSATRPQDFGAWERVGTQARVLVREATVVLG